MLSSKQHEYLSECDHRWNLKIGATGSGKSWLDYAVVIPKRLMALQGQGDAVIIGNTQGTANRNILEPMRKIYGDRVVGSIKNNNKAIIFGQPVYVFGADKKTNVDRIRGMTIEYAYGDEMTTWNQEVFEMLKSRLRCEHSYFDGTANPENPNHYIKQFIDSDADIYCQTSTIFDNPFLPEKFVQNLCNEYEGSVYYKRYILGEWALAEGLIFPMFEEALAEVPNDEAEDICVSIDYGTQNPFAAIKWKKLGGIWYAEKEYYYSGRKSGVPKTDDEYAADLEYFLKDEIEKYRQRLRAYNAGSSSRVPSKIPVIIDPSAASFIALLRKKDWCKVIKADNNVQDGIRETASAMKRGLIKISNSMTEWKKEAEGYAWDDKIDEDRPIKKNDHLMDATRYFVKTKKLCKIRREVNDNLSGF